jgi:hypothetical protein
MAKLTEADAARQLGISRTTLYKLIDQGKSTATPDGLIDDAELVRAVPCWTFTVNVYVVNRLDVRSRQMMNVKITSTYVALVDTLRTQLDTIGHHALRVGGGPCRPPGHA